jgi:hypothetical protein
MACLLIGGYAGISDRPEESQPIVNEVEGFGLVSKMMLSTRDGWVFFILGVLGLPGWLESE